MRAEIRRSSVDLKRGNKEEEKGRMDMEFGTRRRRGGRKGIRHMQGRQRN